jgi:hypothetical protein
VALSGWLQLTSQRTWLLPATLALIVASAVWSFADYWRVFGGDPEIHIVFAMNLLRGYPLQFNPGDFSSGETSPLYMMLVALMYLACGAWVPLAMKALGLASLAGICATLYRAARRQGAAQPAAIVLGALPLFFPSQIFQALLGMENMLFAWCVVLLLETWLEGPAGGRARLAIALAGLPLLFFLRPEALFLGVCLGSLALMDRDWRSLAGLAAAAAATLVAVLAIDTWTGVPLEAAGYLRATLSRFGSMRLELAGVTVYFKPRILALLAYEAPFLILLFWQRRAAGLTRQELTILATLFALPVALHFLTILPAERFSRYAVYANAAFFLVLARNMARLYQRGLFPARALALPVLLLGLTLVPYEHFARQTLWKADVVEAVQELRPEFVRANSDTTYQALGRPPLPVVIAVGEVQLRARLDDRFIVRSLDGVVDYRLASFIRDGWVDQIGYLKARNAAFLFDLVNLNRDQTKFAVRQLPAMGESVAVGGLCFHLLEFEPALPSGQRQVYAVTHQSGC